MKLQDTNLNSLLPIISQHYQGEDRQLVNARSLWKFLESKQEFANWFKSRVDEYEFKANKDYFLITLSKKADKDSNSRGRKPIDYLITLSMAKELAMVEKNAQGKAARQYFIHCETELKTLAPEVHLKLLEQWQTNRELVRTPYRALCHALDRHRQRLGKATPKHIYGNESKMLTAIVLEMSVEKYKALNDIQGEIRAHLSAQQLAELEYLEKADEMLLDADIADFEQRRMKLIAMRNNRFKGKELNQ